MITMMMMMMMMIMLSLGSLWRGECWRACLTMNRNVGVFMAQCSTCELAIEVDSLVVAMDLRVGPEPSPGVSLERMTPPRPSRQSRDSGTKMGEVMPLRPLRQSQAGRPLRQSQAGRSIGSEMGSHGDRVAAEVEDNQLDKATLKKGRALRKKPAAKVQGSAKKGSAAQCDSGECAGSDGSGVRPATLPSTPPRAKRPRTHPARQTSQTSQTSLAKTPPRPTSQTGQFSLASSPISQELKDALPGPMSIHDLCQPATLHVASLSARIGAATLAKRIGKQRWVLHTACSGLGCPEIAGEAIQAALKSLANFHEFKIVHGIKIDKNPAARETLKANFPDACVFGELEEWLEGHARTFARMRLKTQNQCFQHGQDCPLPVESACAA